MPDGFVKMLWHGIPGVFVTAEAFEDMLVGFAMDKVDLSVELAGTKTLLRMAEKREEKILGSAKSLELRAQIGFPLGIGIGVTAAMVIFGVLFGILKATAPAQIPGGVGPVGAGGAW